MTDFASFSNSATSSAVVSRCSPYSSSDAGAVPSEPKPQAITLTKERFIALHMM